MNSKNRTTMPKMPVSKTTLIAIYILAIIVIIANLILVS